MMKPERYDVADEKSLVGASSGAITIRQIPKPEFGDQEAGASPFAGMATG